ncbi:ParA family protein [Sulfoacidibacillus ferrooxidans]|uniref:Sporulation initiation inhibitor protein Soj n=1 Tax=Sulfoacidibacillus ferrooxidans TaxID=2005001 RepID=A0A9X2AFM4_9BACL|nr:ParA family protein [Sulfoacidibacillus ferrooxidans]MCI0184617.1 Sporulation initiation inhibitor protein Soj [Sulfoacidibacillus ferrooxidans]
MGKIISFGLQKGGVGKSTTTGLTSHILSEMGYKVLSVDFDSQGNLTQLLTRRSPYDFVHKTSLEACKEGNPKPYIHKITDNLHLLPAEDFLSQFDKWIYTQVPETKQMTVLKSTLDVVRDEYDYIFIDLPPNLGGLTLNGVCASDFAIVIMQSEPFAYDALERYLEIVQAIQNKVNHNLRLAGILVSLLDARTNIGTYIMERVKEEYSDFVFETVIRRKSRVIEFSVEGVQSKSRSDRDALQQYKNFCEELIKRVNN